MRDHAEKMDVLLKSRAHQDCGGNFFTFVTNLLLYSDIPIFRSSSQENDVFIFKRDVSGEELKHEQVQSDMEIVLLCISIAAITLTLLLLTVLR